MQPRRSPEPPVPVTDADAEADGDGDVLRMRPSLRPGRLASPRRSPPHLRDACTIVDEEPPAPEVQGFPENRVTRLGLVWMNWSRNSSRSSSRRPRSTTALMRPPTRWKRRRGWRRAVITTRPRANATSFLDAEQERNESEGETDGSDESASRSRLDEEERHDEERDRGESPRTTLPTKARRGRRCRAPRCSPGGARAVHG